MANTGQPPASNAGAAIGCLAVLGLAGFFVYVWHSWSEHSEKSARERQEQAAQAARDEENKRLARIAATDRYAALMTKISKDPPATLQHMTEDMGKKADKCERTEDLKLDRCNWLLVDDGTLAVLSYSLAAEGMAGTDLTKWIKLVVFARDGKVEKQIDGAIQQFLGQ